MQTVWTQIRLLLLEQSELDLYCLLKKFQNVLADNKSIQLFVKCALRVDTCEVSVYKVRTFMKCTHVFAAQKAY